MWNEESMFAFVVGCAVTVAVGLVWHINTDNDFYKSKITELEAICEPHGGVSKFSVDYAELTVYCNDDNVQVTTKAR